MFAPKKFLLPVATAWVLALGASAHAQNSDALSLQCGGVTLDESAPMRAARGHALQILFVTMDGGYLADVDTRIEDSGGRHRVEADCGPVGLADVAAPGSYRLRAIYKGVEQVRVLELKPGGGARTVLRWLE